MEWGNTHRFGDNVTTDDIIAGKYKHRTMDLDELAEHLMENVRPGFAQAFGRGDFIVAGSNFGCGSSREQAPAILRHAGCTAVVARSYARIFFRNAVNIGLQVLEADTTLIPDGARLRFDAAQGLLWVEGRDEPLRVNTLPPEMQAIADAGGLLAFVRAGGL